MAGRRASRSTARPTIWPSRFPAVGWDKLAQRAGPPRSHSVVQSEVATETAITDRNLNAYDCVLLCNVAQFTPAKPACWTPIFTAAAAWCSFSAIRCWPTATTASWAGQGRAGGRAAHPARRARADRSTRRSSASIRSGYRHPIVQPFRGRGEAALLTTPIFKYYKLTPPKNSPAKTVLAMANGDPLVVEEPIHRGRVVLVATSAEPRSSWTAMPLWPSFVPLVQEIVAWCAGGDWQQPNLLAGEPLDVLTVGSVAEAPLSVQTPDGRSRPITLHPTDDRPALRYADTTQSGIYVARLGANRSETFAVNVDTAESDLTPISAERIAEATCGRASVLAIRLRGRTSAAPHVAMPARPGSGLHVGLLYAALGLLFAETFLGWKMGR